MRSVPSRVSDAVDTSRMCSGRLSSAARLAASTLEAELRRDHDPVAHRCERLADQLLVGERAVDLGRVEERHATLDRSHGSARSSPAFAGSAGL